MFKKIVAYYSHSGNTKKVAKAIADELNADLYEIVPACDYPNAYRAVVEQARKELKEGFIPSLKSEPVDLSSYEAVFIGTPNWFGTLAPPVSAFIKSNDFNGKTVAPFCTHGGGGISNVERDIKSLLPDSDIRKALAVYSGGGSQLKKAVSNWIKELNF